MEESTSMAHTHTAHTVHLHKPPVHEPTIQPVIHVRSSSTERDYAMPPKAIAKALSSVESVTTPGGPSLAGFEIPQLPNAPLPPSLTRPSPVIADKEYTIWKTILISLAESLSTINFKALLSKIPLADIAKIINEILLVLVSKENQEAFQFVLQHVPDPAKPEIVENILRSVGEVHYDPNPLNPPTTKPHTANEVQAQPAQPNSEEETEKELNRYKEEFNARFDLRTIREEKYQFVMNGIRAAYPDINFNNYIKHVTAEKDHIMRGFLFPDGIRLVVNELKGKGEFSNVDCVVCNSIADAAIQIKAFMAADNAENQTRKGCCFIVRTRDKLLPTSMHVQPIYIERRKNTDPPEYDSIILDSVGAKDGERRGQFEMPYPLSFRLPDYLKKDNLPIRFYHYNIQRQMDGTNCPIFSIRDAVEIARNPAAIMEIAKHAATQVRRLKTDRDEIDETDTNNFIFDTLPPRFMLPTQSEKVFEEYLTQYKQMIDENPSFEHQKQKIKVLPSTSVVEDAQKTIEKVRKFHFIRRVVIPPNDSMNRKDATQNIYIERKYRKYERRVIASVIRQVIADSVANDERS